MQRPSALLLMLVLAWPLSACGDDAATEGPTPWRHARIDGVAGATGVTLVDDDLVFVCGGDDRDIRTVARRDLVHGGRAKARTIALTIRPGAPITGSSPLALQDYRLEHLWKVPVDFQGVAFQRPNVLYVGEATRRLVFWGKLRRDAAGALASVKFDHIAVAPGSDRSGAERGDWSDQGPRLRGLVAVTRSGRMEDLWLVDAGAQDAPLGVRRMDRFGSNLHGLRVRHGLEVAPDARGISHDGARLQVLYGSGRGRIASLAVPPPGTLDSVPTLEGVPGPAVEGVDGWTGMAHAADGTLFLVSGGNPAVVAWRQP